MTFTCPTHGYYEPIPGSTVALCPRCSSTPTVQPTPTPQPPVVLDAIAVIEDARKRAMLELAFYLRYYDWQEDTAADAVDAFIDRTFPTSPSEGNDS